MPLYDDVTEELDRYLPEESRLTPGTGTSFPDAPKPFPDLQAGVRLYDVTRAWIDATWGGGRRDA